MAGSSPARTKFAGEFLPLAASRFSPNSPADTRVVVDKVQRSFDARQQTLTDMLITVLLK